MTHFGHYRVSARGGIGVGEDEGEGCVASQGAGWYQVRGGRSKRVNFEDRRRRDRGRGHMIAQVDRGVGGGVRESQGVAWKEVR